MSDLTKDPNLGRIQEAIEFPTAFAYREFGEPSPRFTARAVANRLTYDDEQLNLMGLGRRIEPAAIVWRGEWDRETSYQTGDGVLLGGAAFIAERENLGLPPTTEGGTQWRRVLDPDEPLFREPKLDVRGRVGYGQALAAAGEPAPVVAMLALVIAAVAFFLAFIAVLN